MMAWSYGEYTRAYQLTRETKANSQCVGIYSTNYNEPYATLYQDINVEKGKTYNICGYIKNNNSNDAYIDVFSVGANVIANKTLGTKVKNSSNFEYYKMSFIASQSGTVRITLVNKNIAYAYFDRINVFLSNEEYQYNLLENSDFKNSLYGWNSTTSYNIITNGIKLSKGSITEKIDISGTNGTKFIFGAFLKSTLIKSNSYIKLSFHNETEISQFTYYLDSLQRNGEYIINEVSSDIDFDYITYEICNVSSSNYLTISDLILYYGGTSYSVTYNTSGDVVCENYGYETYNYTYDDLNRVILKEDLDYKWEYFYNSCVDENLVSSIITRNKSDLSIYSQETYTYNNDKSVNTYNYSDDEKSEIVSYVYEKNNTSSVTKTVNDNSSTTIEKIFYTYDSSNKKTKEEKEIKINGIISEKITVDYIYQNDDLLYLLEETIKGATVTRTLTNYSIETYSADELYILTSEYKGIKDIYDYDYLTGLVRSIQKIDTNNASEVVNSVTYTYDGYGNVIKKVTNGVVVNYLYNSKNQISSITTSGLTYNFSYNDYGDIDSISVNESEIVNYEYSNETENDTKYNSEVSQINYYYGTVSFEYDKDLVTKIYHTALNTNEKILVLENIYDSNGNISTIIDYKEDINNPIYYYYRYEDDNIKEVICSNGNNISYEYDEGNIISKTDINGTTIYEYLEGELKGLTIYNKLNVSYEHSVAGLMKVASNYNSTTSIIQEYIYETEDLNYNNKTYFSYTGRISEVEIKKEISDVEVDICKYTYEYDVNGNITKYRKYVNNVLKYEEINSYNIHKYLVSQDIYIQDKHYNYKYEYNYDSRGNITNYKIYNKDDDNMLYYEYTYHYETSTDGDANNNVDALDYVVKEDYAKGSNSTIYYNYNNVGQATKKGNYNITYYMDQISNISYENTSINYSYNADGIRTRKNITTNGLTKNILYILNDNKILKEIASGSESYTTSYMYDENDNVIGFEYTKDSESLKYYYVKNIQNDITQILDENGNCVVEYFYNGYGCLIAMIDNSTNAIGTKNPFRYKSYYFDNETQLYYLNSRYYDALIGRFLTMDEISYLGLTETPISYNLFNYCENNPINNEDSNGNYALTLGTAGITALGTELAGIIASLKGLIAIIKSALRTLFNFILSAIKITAVIVGVMYVVKRLYDIEGDLTGIKELVEENIKTRKYEDKKDKNSNNDPTIYNVYVFYDGKDVYYVGITNNPFRRMNEHKATKKLKDLQHFIVVLTGLVKNTARVYEQCLITIFSFANIININNSIAKKNWNKALKKAKVLSSLLSSLADSE